MYRTRSRFTPGRILLLIAAALVFPSTVNASGTFRALFEFSTVGGGPPFSSLTLDPAGNLYGTTATAGRYGLGSVFKLTRNQDGTWAENILYSFQGGSDGSYPLAEVIFDSAGNLYGTTNNGGGCQSSTLEFGCGTIYRLTPQSDGTWTETTLYRFTGGADGAEPGRGPLLEAAGGFYGNAASGGKGWGVVFKLTPNPDGSWSQHVLHTFRSSDGAGPVGGVVSNTAGNLYGQASYGGGNNGCGVVYKLSQDSNGNWSETVLHRFCSSIRDGAFPLGGGLAFDSAGDLYGGTIGGAASVNCRDGCGTIFRLKHNSDGSWSYRKIHTFMGTPAWAPFAGLTIDAAGTIYGTTVRGGSADKGVIFKLTHNPDGSWTMKVLHNFLGKPAAYPYARLILDKAGSLYGTTVGTNLCCNNGGLGVVFKMIP